MNFEGDIMKKLRVIAVIVMLVGLFGQVCYGITYEELKEKCNANVDYSKMTWEEALAFRDGKEFNNFEAELSKYIDYNSLSRLAFRMAGYEESLLERSKYLGFDEKFLEGVKVEDLSPITRGYLLKYLFIFNGKDTEGYEDLFEDRNLVTWEEAEEMTKSIKHFVWNEEFQTKEMWSDEEFIDYVNNNPDSSNYLWTKNLILDGRDITIIASDNRNVKMHLIDRFTNIPNINDRVFEMLKILTFHAVKEGGTVTLYGEDQQGYIWIGFNGEHLAVKDAWSENFRIVISDHPWNYRDKNTVITLGFNRMYKLNRYYTEASLWNSIYPSIAESTMKALYQDSYSEELFAYFKKIAKGYSMTEDKSYNGIDTFIRTIDSNVVYTKIK
jgi:hypothetical protein